MLKGRLYRTNSRYALRGAALVQHRNTRGYVCAIQAMANLLAEEGHEIHSSGCRTAPEIALSAQPPPSSRARLALPIAAHTDSSCAAAAMVRGGPRLDDCKPRLVLDLGVPKVRCRRNRQAPLLRVERERDRKQSEQGWRLKVRGCALGTCRAGPN